MHCACNEFISLNRKAIAERCESSDGSVASSSTAVTLESQELPTLQCNCADLPTQATSNIESSSQETVRPVDDKRVTRSQGRAPILPHVTPYILEYTVKRSDSTSDA